MSAQTEAAQPGPPRGRWATGPQKVTIVAVAVAAAAAALVLSNWLASSGTSEKQTRVQIAGPGKPLTQPAPAPRPLPMPAAAPSLQSFTAPVIQLPNASKATSAPVLSYAAAGSGPAEGGHPVGALGEEARLRAADKAEDDPLTASLRPSRLGGASKAHLIRNADKTINRGEPIPCSLKFDINSQLPGIVTCITQTEIRNIPGTVTLMDRGTQLFGEVKYGIKRGQDRLFILWTWATIPMKTRHGIKYVDVEIDSPAADTLGAPGVPGDVNHHYAQRFLAAGLFTVIEAAPQIAASALQNGSNNSYTSFNSSPAQSLAGTILQDTINIPDTLTKNHGDNVMVVTARQLDFSGVVGFEMVNDQ